MNRDDGWGDVEWLDISVDVIAEGTELPSEHTPRGQWWWYAIPVLAVAVVLGLIATGRNHPASAPPPTRTAAAAAPPPRPVVVTDFGHRLLGITANYELFLRSPDSVVRIEFNKGRITTTRVPYLSPIGRVSFVVGTNRVIVRPADEALGYGISDGKPPTGLTGGLDRGAVLFPGPKVGQFWMQTGNTEMSLFDQSGRPTGVHMDMPDNSPWDFDADGSGYLLFRGDIGLAAVRPGSVRQLSEGQLLAAGRTSWLIQECDPGPSCSWVLVDHSTRKRRVIEANIPRTQGITGAISPVGATAALLEPTQYGSELMRLDLVNLKSGATVQLPPTLLLSQDMDGNSLTWSPDGRWIFAIWVTGTVIAVDVANQTVHLLGVPLPENIRQLAIRP